MHVISYPVSLFFTSSTCTGNFQSSGVHVSAPWHAMSSCFLPETPAQRGAVVMAPTRGSVSFVDKIEAGLSSWELRSEVRCWN